MESKFKAMTAQLQMIHSNEDVAAYIKWIIKSDTAKEYWAGINSKFDIDRDDLYRYKEPKERTRARLLEIAECGMTEVGVAEFGYKGVMSGLYIENVWNYSDEDFKSYMDWAKGLIQSSKCNCSNFKVENKFFVCTDCGKKSKTIGV